MKNEVLQTSFFRLQRFVPYVVFLVCLSASLWAVRRAWWSEREEKQHQFTLESVRIGYGVRSQLGALEDVLHGARGLFDASRSVERDEWRAFSNGFLHTDATIPLVRLSYVESVSALRLTQFLHRARKDGARHFQVWPKRPSGTHRGHYAVQKYIESKTTSTRIELGQDLSRLPRYWPYLRASADNGTTVLTSRAASQDAHRSSIIDVVHPVGRHARLSPDRAQQHLALEGWVVASFEVRSIIGAIRADISPNIDIEIFDGKITDLSNLLFDDDRNRGVGDLMQGPFRERESLNWGGHEWTIQTTALGAFETSWWSPYCFAVLLAGGLGSCVLSWIVYALLSRGEQAHRTALQTASTLSQREDRYRSLFESSGSIVIVISSDLEITEWNAKAEALFRNSKHNLQGETFIDALIPEAQRGNFRDHLEAVRGGRSEHDLETTVTTAAGVEVVLLWSLSTISGCSDLILSAKDITRRKNAERDLISAKETADIANRSKSEFLMRMSHELRTPMNGIIGMNQLALETSLSTEQRECLDMVKTSADGLLAIVGDILDFSKLDSGRVVLADEPFNLRTTIEHCVRLAQNDPANKQRYLLAEFVGEVSTLLRGDAVRLAQIVNNILANACKFSCSQAAVFVHVAVAMRKDYRATVDIGIADTGIGIPPTKQEVLFRPFTQGEEPHNRKYGGVGLGLAIAKRLVELMHGEISVQSVVNVGSRFRLSIPFEVAQESTIEGRSTVLTSSKPVPEQRALGGRHILVAEDNFINQKLILALLRRAGHSVELVGDGELALAKYTAERFDLILLDIRMPKMSGIEVAEAIRIRERESGCHTPIVAITAYATQSDRGMCLAAGMDDYLSKPYHDSALRSLVSKWTAGQTVTYAVRKQS